MPSGTLTADHHARTGTALDEADVRKILNRILDAAEIDRRPHQMHPMIASQFLQDGADQRLEHQREELSQNVASWNRIAGWLRRIETLRGAA